MNDYTNLIHKLKNVLIIEDNAEDIYMLKRYLHKMLASIELISVCETAKKAFAELAQKKYDLIILDYMLNDMNGLAFMRKLLESEKPIKTPIIMLTGQGNEQVAVEAIKLGAQDYLIKNTLTEDSLAHAVSVVMDRAKLVEEVSEKNQKISHMAFYDYLTDLPNRAQLEVIIEKSLAQATRNKKQLALMMIDIDDFKKVNDTFGHHEGDKLLQQISLRLNSVIRGGDTLARIGGDEFALLTGELSDPSEAAKIALKLVNEGALPFAIEKKTVHVSLSLGIAIFPEAGQDVLTLFRNADRAMYRVKNAGKNGFQFYSEEMQKNIEEKQKMEDLLRDALDNNAVEAYYQPIFTLSSPRMVNAIEVLTRVKDNAGNLISPENFKATFHQTPEIHKIVNRVMEQSFEDFSKIKAILGYPCFLSINVFPDQFLQRDFVNFFDKLLSKYQINASELILEIDEFLLSKKEENIFEKIKDIAKKGCKVVVDNFGSGRGSLLFLKQEGISGVKVDPLFLEELTEDSEVMIQSIIAMAQYLQLDLVFKGIESKERLDFILKFSPQYGQGFYLAEPMPLPALLEKIKNKTFTQ